MTAPPDQSVQLDRPVQAPLANPVPAVHAAQPSSAQPEPITLDYQQLFSATAGNNITVVPASPQNNYVLTSDTDVANPTGLVWKAVAGSGVIQTNAPLDDQEVQNVSTFSINFSANVGEIPYGTGVAKTGVLTNVPQAGKSTGFKNCELHDCDKHYVKIKNLKI